MEAKLWH
jgi:6-phosphogluconolactonase (cycloisomerase 2 family)